MKHTLIMKFERYERMVLFTKMSAASNMAIAAAKLLLGLFSLSFFVCVNGLYSLGMGMAKIIALRGHYQSLKDGEDGRQEYRCYFLVGLLILCAGIAYMVYCFRLFFYSDGTQYRQIVAITIAAVTFTELGIAIRGVFITRRDRRLVAEAIKMANLSSALISLVLTQSALLSFSDTRDLAYFNGLSGILFGAGAALIDLSMMVHMNRVLTGKNHQKVLKKANRIAGKYAPELPFEAYSYEDKGPQKRTLYVKLGGRISREDYARMKAKIEQKLRLELVHHQEEALS